MSGGLEYHRLHRAVPWAWWRTLLGVVAMVVMMTVVVPLGVLALFAIGSVATGTELDEAFTRITDTGDLTPVGLAYLNVAIAAMIPVTFAISWLLHGLRPAWLGSVTPRIRWRWLVICLALAVLALVATLVVGALLPQQAETTEMSGEVNDFTTTTRDFLLIVLFLTPLQAAGEEYVFRGYLTQAFGGLVRARWFAVLLPALLFALAHGPQDPAIFFDRFAFGIVSGLLVILTGGLEAGIAMHVLNNWLAFGITLAFGDMGTVLNPTGGSWWSIPVTLTQSLSFLVLVVLTGRGLGLQTRTRRAVLVAPDPRV